MTENKIWITAEELYESDIKEPNWLVENVIAEKGITFFGGNYTSFKSYLAFIMAIYGAKEMPVLGVFKTKKFKTLIIDEENKSRRK